VRFETIILLIVAFNVVTAVLQRRAKKKAREAAERAARSPEPASSPRASRPDRIEDDDADDADLRMPSLGRDILDQIARDLGLKTPKPAPPPAPREARPAPAPAPVFERPWPTGAREAAEVPVIAERRETENRRPESPYVIPDVEVAVASDARSSGRAATAKEPARSKVRGEALRKTPVVASVPLAPRLNLRDPARLREAFVMQEILGAPVSRRERGLTVR
jgi:hypothetical protein